MSRRRGGNPLLIRMIGIAVLVTMAILPILAYLGAFKAGKAGLMQVSMITQPVPKVPKEKSQRKPQHAKPHESAHRSEAKAPVSTKALPVHVAATQTQGPPTDNTIVNGTGGNVGAPPLPVPPKPADNNPPQPIVPAPQTQPPPPPPVKAPAPPPVITPPPPPPAPHVPVIVAAVPLAQPQPEIPDDLRDEIDSAEFGALLTIHADGTVEVTKEHSTGNDRLDKIALETARKWKFKPATKDGVPAQSYLHVDIDFEVS